MEEIYSNRKEAGEKLGNFLTTFDIVNPYIFGIARGGVAVGAEVSKIMNAPLDVIIIKKLGMPCDPELAFGAMAPEGVMFVDQSLLERFAVTGEQITEIEKNAKASLDEAVEKFRGTEDYPDLSGKNAIIVDDGIATGATAHVSLGFIGKLNPKKIIVATPVCPLEIYEEIKAEADQVIALQTPENFMAVGEYYLDFPPLTEEEVTDLIR